MRLHASRGKLLQRQPIAYHLALQTGGMPLGGVLAAAGLKLWEDGSDGRWAGEEEGGGVEDT